MAAVAVVGPSGCRAPTDLHAVSGVGPPVAPATPARSAPETPVVRSGAADIVVDASGGFGPGAPGRGLVARRFGLTDAPGSAAEDQAAYGVGVLVRATEAMQDVRSRRPLPLAVSAAAVAAIVDELTADRSWTDADLATLADAARRRIAAAADSAPGETARTRWQALAGRIGDPPGLVPAPHPARASQPAGDDGRPRLDGAPSGPARPVITPSMTVAELLSTLPDLPAAPVPPAPDLTGEARLQAERRYVRGASALADGRILQALTDLELAARLDPGSAAIRRRLARAHAAADDRSRAAEAWRAVLERAPQDPEASTETALHALRTGAPRSALLALRPWLEDPAGDADVVMLVAAVDAARRLGAAGAVIDLADRAGAVVARSGTERDWSRIRDAELLEAPWQIDATVADAHANLGRWAESLGRAIGGWEAWRTAGAPAEADRYPPVELTTRVVRAALHLGQPAIARAAIAAHGVARPGTTPVPGPDSIASDTSASPASPASSASAEAAARRAAEESLALATWLTDVGGDGRAADADLMLSCLLRYRATRAATGTASVTPRDFGRVALDALALVDGRGAAGTPRVADPSDLPGPADHAIAGAAEPLDIAAAIRASTIISGVVRRGEPEGIGGAATTVLDAGAIRGLVWPHPVPRIVSMAARAARAMPEPLTLTVAQRTVDRLASADEVLVLSAMVEASGHAGEAWRLAGIALEREPSSADAHLVRLRLAGQMRDAGAVARVRQAAAAVDRRITGSPAWEAGLALAMLRVEDAAFAADASGRTGPGVRAPATNDGTEAAHLRALVRTLAEVERSMLADESDQRRADLAAAARRLAAIGRTGRGSPAAWATLSWLVGPSGPVRDGRAARELRAAWASTAPGDARLRHEQRRVARLAGRGTAVLADARLQRRIDPGDDLAVQDVLLGIEATAGHEAAIDEALRDLARHPADPGRAEALMRLEVSAISPDVAWTRIRSRLAARPDDLVAMRLGEIAAGIAGEPLTRLVLGEERLLRRPPSARRSLLIAGLSRDAGQTGEVLAEIRRFLDHLPEASGPDILGAAAILQQVGSDASRDLTVDLASRVVGRPDPDFDDLIFRGVRKAGLADPAGAAFGRLTAAAAARSLRRDPGDGDTILPWRSVAQRFIDAGRPEAAIRALTIRAAVEEAVVARAAAPGPPPGGDPADVEQLLATMIIAADAALGASIESALRSPAPALRIATRASVAPNADDRAPAFTDWRVTERGAVAGDATREVIADLERSAGIERFAASMGEELVIDPADGGSTVRLRAAALHRAAGMHRLAGAHRIADAVMSAASTLRPEDPGILNDIGYTQLEAARVRGDAASVATATALLERAAAGDPDDLAIADSLGWARYHQGRFADALPLLERAAADDELSPEVALHLGDTLWRLDRRDDAVRAWRRASAETRRPGYRSEYEQRFESLQTGLWGLLVRDPAAMYDAVLAPAADGIAARLAAADADRDVPVAPVFADR